MKIPAPFPRVAAMLPCLFFLAATAVAQQTPVTGQMMGQGGIAPQAPGGSVASTSSSAATGAAPAPHGYVSDGAAPRTVQSPRPVTVMGETTRSLLQMQVDGRQAGERLPMLGAEASASYDRYLKSFSHEIPEFYKTAVGKDSNGNAGGQ